MMQLEDYFDFMSEDVIRLRGHRIDIAHVLEYYHEGYSPEAICMELPTLSLEKIHATITYYLHNRDTIDAYLARQRTHAERLMREHDGREPSPGVQKIRAMRAQRSRGQAA